MEYVNAVNVVTLIIVLLMVYYLKKILTGDIGDNRFFYLIAFVVLGAGLYLWRSGTAEGIIEIIQGVMK